MKLIVSYSPPARRNSDALDRLSMRLCSASSQLRRPIRRLAMSLLLISVTPLWMMPFGPYQDSSKPNDSPPVPLTLAEKRIVHGQLFELKILRVEVEQYRLHEQQALQQYEDEKKVWESKIQAEKQSYELSLQKVAIVEHERDLAVEKAQFYQTSLNVCRQNKKTGFWCKLGKIFTLGIKRCK